MDSHIDRHGAILYNGNEVHSEIGIIRNIHISRTNIQGTSFFDQILLQNIPQHRVHRAALKIFNNAAKPEFDTRLKGSMKLGVLNTRELHLVPSAV